MKASCICPTYGRAPYYLALINEAVESFLLQDYPDKELIILNDCGSQTLQPAFDLPGVRIVNESARYATLGEKYNALCELATGDVILPWEDDDISLPGRISQAVSKLESGEYFNPQRSWYYTGRLHHDHAHGVCHNASAFLRHLWRSVQYPHTTGKQDADYDNLLRNRAAVCTPLGNDPSEWQYIYRWGVSPVHLSGNIAGVWEGVTRDVMPGTFFISPAWKKDYSALCLAASKAGRKPQ